MVALSFHSQYKDLILSRSKLTTIRNSRRCNPGDKLQFFTGWRTKNVQKFADAICKNVSNIEFSIKDNTKIITVNDKILIVGINDEEISILVKQEGFSSIDYLFNTIDKLYKLPFRGFIYSWDLIDNK